MQKGQQHSGVPPARGQARPRAQSGIPVGCRAQALAPDPASRWIGSVSPPSAEPGLKPHSPSRPEPSPPGPPEGCFSVPLSSLLFITPWDSRRHLCHVSWSLIQWHVLI